MLKASLRALAFAAGLLTTTSLTNAAITDGKFGTNQIFDVQYYWSGDTLNASNFIAPYDMNFQHPTVGTGQYFQFFDSTTNPGTYGLGLYNSDGTLAQVVHDTGTLQAIGPDALFYIGSGFFGTVITTGAGYAYGSSASFTNMDQSVTATDTSSYTWASTTPLAAGETASSNTSGGTNSFPASNAQFQNGLTGWTAGGGTGTQASTAYSGTGIGVAVVSEMTSYQASGSQYSWTVKPPVGDQMVSIQPTGMQNNGVNSFDDMCADLGISTDSKNEIVAAMMASGNGAPTNAAWIKQDITLSSGQSFTMSWQYISTDYVPFNDGSITSLVNTTGTIVATVNGESKEYALLGFTNPGTGNYSVGSYGATGWQTAYYTANEAGTYTLGFGAFNLSDTALSPILFVTKDLGTTLNFTTPFGPIAPNAGSSAPNNSSGSPTVVSTAPGTPIVSSISVDGIPVVTSVTNTDMVTSTDGMGNDVVTTYFTVTTTTTTPTTVTTTTTPVTITTYSDGSTTSTNGTPVVTTEVIENVASTTTDPAIQSVATTEPVVSGTTTTAGTATITESIVEWPAINTTTVANSATKVGDKVTVTQLTTTLTDTPFTTTTVTDTPITTTTTVVPTTTTVDADGNVIGTSTADPINSDSTIIQSVTTTTAGNSYTTSQVVDTATVNVGGIQDSIDWAAEHPFLVDPFTTADGAWVSPGMDWGSTSNGKMSSNNFAFGYQQTVGEVTAGIAGNIGSTESSGYENAKSQSNNYSAMAYVLDKGDLAWVKGSIGIGYSEHTNSMGIQPFHLYSQDKAKQTIGYADVAVYAPWDISGWKPFVGATAVMSNIGDIQSSGSELISSPPAAGTNTTVAPYAGVQYNVDKDVSVELKTTQSPVYGTVVSGKALVKKEIAPNTSVNLSVSHSKGQNYDDTTVMVGFTWKF